MTMQAPVGPASRWRNGSDRVSDTASLHIIRSPTERDQPRLDYLVDHRMLNHDIVKTAQC
jgi:hypothetical protein